MNSVAFWDRQLQLARQLFMLWQIGFYFIFSFEKVNPQGFLIDTLQDCTESRLLGCMELLKTGMIDSLSITWQTDTLQGSTVGDMPGNLQG